MHAGAWTMAFLIATLLSVGISTTNAGQAKQKLQGHYKEWLEHDVIYIITKGEREAFLHLTTDDARDKFIADFWEIRNPTPGAPSNSFKDEHYERLAYANDHFGHESGNPGWRTAMGRTYIVLGPPSQKSNYHDSQNLRPMEVWFYSNSHAALPPFFYLVFYREDNFSEYKLYSPYFDGPEKLVTQRGETRLQAWQTIDKNGGRELARVALSLIPGEPLDTQNATSGLESDVMLGILRDLANHPLSLHEFDLRRANAKVSASLIFQNEELGALVLPVRDSAGNTKVDYLLRFSRPEYFFLEKTDGTRFSFKVGIRAKVYGANSKLLFTQEREYIRHLTPAQVEQVKSRVFGYEGSLPLPPGKYHLELELTDWVKKATYRVNSDVVVPHVPTEGMTVTSVVPFSLAKPVSGDTNFIPFTFGGVKFTPLLNREANFSAGGQLKIFYQIWTPPIAPGTDQKLKVSYAYGRPGATRDSQTLEDEVAKAQFDANGSLINGKEIPIGDWPQGSYKLVLTLDDPSNHQQAFSNLNFRLSADAEPSRSWEIDDREDSYKDKQAGVSDYQRGICHLAMGEYGRASEAFRRALEKDASSQQVLTALVDAEFSRQAYEEVAKYAGQVILSDQTPERTILHLAESLDKTGDTRKAAELLESHLKIKGATGPIYLTLAEYYGRLGNSKKAEEYGLKGKQLMSASTPAQ